jgi:hypothetical protein
MKVPIMKHILLPSLLFIGTLANAQDVSTPEPTADALEAAVSRDLSALNAHFTGIARFSIDKRQRLVAEYLDNGIAYRTDIAYLDFLDASTCSYNEEERTLMLHCQDPRSKCIDKELRKNGTISPTGRMNLPVPAGDERAEKARQLLSSLVEHKQSEQLTRLAEVNTRVRH